jgi:hypothetical protein
MQNWQSRNRTGRWSRYGQRAAYSTNVKAMKEMHINEPFLESLGIILFCGWFERLQARKQAKSRKEMFFRTFYSPSSKFIYFIEPI